MLTPVSIDAVQKRILDAAAPLSFAPQEKFPDRMFDACRAGAAQALADDDAVVVLRRDFDPTDGRNVLFVWWGHTEKRGAGVPAAKLAELQVHAKRLNCQRLAFESTLEMWLRRAPLLGWALRTIRFEMDVQDEPGHYTANPSATAAAGDGGRRIQDVLATGTASTG